MDLFGNEPNQEDSSIQLQEAAFMGRGSDEGQKGNQARCILFADPHCDGCIVCNSYKQALLRCVVEVSALLNAILSQQAAVITW